MQLSGDFSLSLKDITDFISIVYSCVRPWCLFLGTREDYSSLFMCNFCLTVQEAFLFFFFFLLMFQ